MRESSCESLPPDFTSTIWCNTDQRSFKAYLSRFMGYAYQLAPFTRDWVTPRLKASAAGAALACTGGEDGDTCGLSWLKGSYDGAAYGVAIGGVGEHMAAMEVFQNLIVGDSPLPLNNKTGTSKGDPSAGSGSYGLSAEDLQQTSPTTAGDKAGAGILTALCLGLLLALTAWLIKE